MKANKKVESGKQDSIFLSIVIPAYNSKAWLPQCLDSIKEQVNRPEVEVIIVDSSEEDVTPFINERYPFVRTFHLPERAFPGTARTFGISKAKGEVIAFIDTDCEANDAWIANIITSQRNGRNVVGGPVANGTPDSLIGTSEYLLEFSEMAPAMPEGDVRFIPTCNISFKKSAPHHILDAAGAAADPADVHPLAVVERGRLSKERVFHCNREIDMQRRNHIFSVHFGKQWKIGRAGIELHPDHLLSPVAGIIGDIRENC